MNLISIVIPIYNKEKYIKQCLQSIVNQSYQDLEIICVDDGSNDNSVRIVEDLKKKDKRIILFKNNHLGPSKARNFGINHCKGDYVHFVDADDIVKQDTYKIISRLINLYKEIDLIMFYFDHCIKNIDNNTKIHKMKDFKSMFKSKNPQYFKMKDNPKSVIEICDGANLANKIFNLKLIRKFNIKLNSHLMFYEDSDFYYQYIIHSNNILALPYDFYCYRHEIANQQTQTKENIKNVYLSIFDIYYNMKDDFNKLGNEYLVAFVKSILNIAFTSYKAISNIEARFIANQNLLNFINDNLKYSFFKEPLLQFKNEVELVKFNSTAILLNNNLNSKKNSLALKIGKIILSPLFFLKHFKSNFFK